MRQKKAIIQIRTFLILIFFLFINTFSFGQFGAFNNDDNLLNAGLGLNSYYSQGMPVGGSFEFGITDDISVGVSLHYLAYNVPGVLSDFDSL